MRFFTIFALLMLSIHGNLYSQALVNNYANIYIKPGAQVYVKTNSVNNNKLIDNGGELTIEQDFINNDLANGGGANGKYFIQNDWINNGNFTADQSLVRLYGDDQLITGTSITSFYDLELTGTGIKRQTINSETSHVLALNDRELATDEYEMLVSNPATNAITRTTGFVSSLDMGRLSRNTNVTAAYLFPTGSSLGVTRYRPIDITPNATSPHTYGVRLANTDATTEGFDRNVKETEICEVNPNYYHRIYRTNGTVPANIQINYDLASDGVWADAGHWQNIPQWENTTAVPGLNPPFYIFRLNAWNDFTYSPFALVKFNPIISLSAQDATCRGVADGAASATVTTGIPPYSYEWSNGGSTSGINDLTGGVYTLTITDNSNCTAVESVTVEEPDLLTSFPSINSATCEGLEDGGIKLNPFGGTAPYTAQWSNGDTSLSPTDLAPGFYTATITDANNCITDTVMEVTSTSIFNVEATGTDAACEGASSGSVLTEIISGTTPPFTYLWNTGDTTSTLTGVVPGTYSITVKDVLDCEKNAVAIVSISGIDLEEEITNASCPDVPDGSLAVTVLGGNAPYNYTWSNGATSPDQPNIRAGVYFLTVTDNDNCEVTETYTIITEKPDSECDFLVIYDVFSPNSDGVNDIWVIDGLSLYPENEIQIFNRWGNLVFEARPYNNDWEGRSNKGELLPVATYYYILKLNNTDQTIHSGHINLLR